MRRIIPIQNTAGKVILGFFFAAIFLIAIAGLTYYTLDRLLLTLDELSQPNEKLTILNELQLDIIQVTQQDPKADLSMQDSLVSALNSKLSTLAAFATDSTELADIRRLEESLTALIHGYVALYEIKEKLGNRNFSQEALKKVELDIRRRALSSQIPIIERGYPGDKLGSVGDEARINQSSNLPSSFSAEEKELLSLLLQFGNASPEDPVMVSSATLDSTLQDIRSVIHRIYLEESSQRRKLSDMERVLSEGQNEIIGTIQNLVSTLQKRTLEDSNQKNLAAYGLSYHVTVLLIVLVCIALLGISLMIFSILKGIKRSKAYQENLLISQQKSEELARSKQEFLANMSHEIRNPLHVIQGYRSMMEKSKLNSAQRSHIRMIGFASDTLMEIVDEVLDFSKLEAGKLKLEKKELDPEILFGSIQDFFELKAVEKQLEFRWYTNLPEGCSLVGDELRLKQILNNLLSNAFKFTEAGSIEVQIAWGENVLCVEVLDTGIGMSEEVLQRIFTEFDQADTSISRKYGGTGLGLAIVNRLVRLNDGVIHVESTENVGTKMRVELPMALGGKPKDATQEPIKSLNLAGKHILLVDDDPIGIRYLETILNYFGASCQCYIGGLTFRDSFLVEDFDMAIIDIQMPGFSGFEVVKILRACDGYSTLPILAMTANVFVEERKRLFQVGFDDLLLKPFQESALVEAIGGFFEEALIYGAVSSQVLPSTEKGYDLSDLQKFCMKDEELLREIISEFIAQAHQDLLDIKQAKKKGDFGRILEITHQLGSRLGQIKSESSQIAKKIETNLKMGIRNGVEVLLDTLEDSLLDLLFKLGSDPLIQPNQGRPSIV